MYVSSITSAVMSEVMSIYITHFRQY